MYERIDECPICHSSKLHNHLICKDHFLTQESFALQRCEHCDHVFTNPRPTTETIQRYYDSKDYLSHHAGQSIKAKVYELIRFLNTRRKYKIIQQYQPKGKLLDYGCGSAHFLSAAPDSFERYGYEPIAAPVTNQNIQYLHAQHEIVSAKKFDVITMWHVLEHVHDPHETIHLLRSVLKNDGHLFVAMPNHQSYDAQYYAERWAGYDVPRHLHHFNQHSFRVLLKSQKLKLVDTKPLYFDSFYVSQLSQTYSPHPSPFNALVTAAKSNLLARTNMQYSSLIYIVRK